MADYLLEKGNILKFIKMILSDSEKNDSIAINLQYLKLNKIEMEYVKKNYPINFNWRRKYMRKVNSY
jgi:hypothetical protein